MILVTNHPALYSATRHRIEEDIFPDAGPLGGIHAGLTAADAENVFVTACDMPNVNLSFVRWVCRMARKQAGLCDIIALKLDNSMFEPMNAVYSRRCLPYITQMLEQKKRKVSELITASRTLYLTETQLDRFGGAEKLFFNMNTPQQIQRYLNEIETQDGMDTSNIRPLTGELIHTPMKFMKTDIPNPRSLTGELIHTPMKLI